MTYHVRAALRGTTPNAARCAAVLENALWEVGHLTNVDGSDDAPLKWAYEALTGESVNADKAASYGTIQTLRERFRRAVVEAEKAMDMADAELRHIAEGSHR
jgi:hypothetical protein